MDLYAEVANENFDANKLVYSIVKDPSVIPDLFEGLSHEKASVRFGCQKALLEISKTNPDLIYPFFDAVVELLHHKNNIFVWSTIIMIGNLATVDTWNKLDFHLPEMLKMLNVGKMITANNTAEALGKIAVSKPKLKEKIVEELLKTENYKYDTKECHNILTGKIIDALGYILKFSGELPRIHDVKVYITKATSNSRKSTKEKAEKLLKLLN